MIEGRNFAALREVFREWPPADVAEVILDLPEDEQVIIFRVLPHDLAADVFEYLDLDAQQKLLRAMAHEQVVGILNEMAPDDRTALLEELPSAAARQLIRLLTPEERRIATALLGYPEDSVGRLMTPDFIAVHEGWTVQQVLDYVREHGKHTALDGNEKHKAHNGEQDNRHVDCLCLVLYCIIEVADLRIGSSQGV